VGGTHASERGREQGQALTEIALCLPILCILMMAIVQYGIMIWRDMELTNAARDGARHAVVARVEPTPAAAVKSTVRASLDTIDPDSVDVTVNGGWEHGDQVTVSVSTPHRLDVLGFEVWSGRLRATSTVRIG
jgi:Flp pilus assembly protein TadG